MDEKQTQLEWEARAGRGAAGAAIVSALLVVGSFAARAAIGPGSSKHAKSLRIAHDHVGDLWIYSVVTALSFLLMSMVLLYLYRVTRFRRQELPNVAAVMSVVGPVLLTIAGIAGIVFLLQAADDFLGSGAQTEARAKDLSETGAISTFRALGLAGSLATGVALLLISLNAMRAGLLSRFMGTLGILLGALMVLPLVPAPVVQVFWLGALAVLFLNRWPQGRGPAWETGEAIPWPTAQDRLGEGEAERDDVVDAPVERQPSPRSRKRKKKKGARR